MKFIADLHIHSHYSIATSKQLVPEYLDYWARRKGITVVGTGDITHPGWLEELKEKVTEPEPGLFRLKDQYRLDGSAEPTDRTAPSYLSTPTVPPGAQVRFLLTGEISSIYKRGEKVRKVHNIVLLPGFEAAETMQKKLDAVGNITSDGRPILGLDSRDVMEIVLSSSDDAALIPAHIWTPWFSALGSKSGFDTIEECYDDLSDQIFAVETGLSSDPPMNWVCRFLDRYTIISNSDAHSPEKLGREANLFDTELSYPAVLEAMQSGDDRFLGTVEFFPQEGKYHYDGHRKCGVRWDPLETVRRGGICPVCGKKVTVGVTNRVAQLADRDDPE
jgi:PHP family Zn ribbon phosphoesterase